MRWYLSPAPFISASSAAAFPATSLGFTILLLLLLLPSQLHLWASPFFLFFCCLPSYISGLHHSSSSSVFPIIFLGFTILFLLLPSQLYPWGSPFWVRFLRMWPFFNPTKEVVTFRLRVWCKLGVFLLDVRIFWVHARESMCALTWLRFIYCHPKKKIGNRVRTHVNSKGKKKSTRGSEGGGTRDVASRRTSCIWPVHEVKRALPSTAGSLEPGSLNTRGSLFGGSTSHHPRVLIGYWVHQLSPVKWLWGGARLDKRTMD